MFIITFAKMYEKSMRPVVWLAAVKTAVDILVFI